jgi:hypothetical protein
MSDMLWLESASSSVDNSMEHSNAIIKDSKEHLNLLEWEIKWVATNETLWNGDAIKNFLANEWIMVSEESMLILPEIWHDVDVITTHVLSKASAPDDWLLSRLNTDKIKAKMFSILLKQVFSLNEYNPKTNDKEVFDIMFAKKPLTVEKTVDDSQVLQKENGILWNNSSHISFISKLDSIIAHIRKTPSVESSWIDWKKIEREGENEINEDILLERMSQYNSSEQVKINYSESKNNEYWGEMTFAINWMMDKFNSIITTMMPKVQHDMLKAAGESHNRTQFFEKTGKKNDFLMKIIWFFLDISWKIDFNEAKTKWWIIDNVLSNYAWSSIRKESENCLKDFFNCDSKSNDEMNFEIKDGNTFSEVPIFQGKEKSSVVVNRLIHWDNMFSTLEKRYSSKFIRFSPEWLAGYAKENWISQDDNDKEVVFNMKYNAREVSPKAWNREKWVLFKKFIIDKIDALWTDTCDDKLKKSITSWENLTAYLFGEYVKWRYLYHQTFLDNAQV